MEVGVVESRVETLLTLFRDYISSLMVHLLGLVD